LHAHEVVGSLWVWTPIISISSSSYIQSTKKKLHIFFSLESDHGLLHAWVAQAFLSSYLHYSSSFFVLKGCVNLSFHLFFFLVMFLLLQAQSSSWWSLFAPSFKSLLHYFPTF
jgi:hypothetical protein